MLPCGLRDTLHMRYAACVEVSMSNPFSSSLAFAAVDDVEYRHRTRIESSVNSPVLFDTPTIYTPLSYALLCCWYIVHDCLPVWYGVECGDR